MRQLLSASFAADDPLLGRAQGFVCAMQAADPATGAPHAFDQFADDALDVVVAGGGSLDADSPADPLVASER